MPPSAKKCPRCLVMKSAGEYYIITSRSGVNKGGQNLGPYCKLCSLEYRKEWERRNTTVVKAYTRRKKVWVKRWRDSNMEHVLKENRKWRNAMPAEWKRARYVKDKNTRKSHSK